MSKSKAKYLLIFDPTPILEQIEDRKYSSTAFFLEILGIGRHLTAKN